MFQTNKNDIQTHSMSLAIMSFDRPYMIHHFLYVFNCNYVSICTVSEILSLISQTLKTSRDLYHSMENIVISMLTLTWRTNVQKLNFLALAIV